jgi:hypothetical protein
MLLNKQATKEDLASVETILTAAAERSCQSDAKTSRLPRTHET